MRRAFRNPRRVFYAVFAQLLRLQDEADLNWRWALGAEPATDYATWLLSRRCEPCAQSVGGGRELFTLLLDVGGADAHQIDASCESILRQSHQGWRICLVGAPANPEAAERVASWKQKLGCRLADGREQIDGSSLIGCFRAGDVMSDAALATFAACFEQRPEMTLAYCDETRIDHSGRLTRIWRPGWSPTLQRSVNYIGRAAVFRRRLLGEDDDWRGREPDALIERLVSRSGSSVGSIARPLFTFPTAPSPAPKAAESIYSGPSPLVSIIIPTRDRTDLLEPCLESVFARTHYGNYEVMLVDNGSRQSRTHAPIGRMQREQTRFKLLRSPGRFNFSALCNAGADAAAGRYLLFLNNDTEIVTPDWIERLLFFATQAGIGAVGAKLLFPDRTVQHVGVVLGMGGVAGHFGAGLKETAPGWMGRNLYPHDVSAVTGACLMVERRKFEAAGRFDEENLPVDLNDVDLCLRLSEKGWRCVCQSQAVLIHRQSASRGGGLRLQRVYAGERRYFMER
ncbi:MAG: glycosyltransferase family 2 protein [Methylocystis sp.]|uniref:glycosyltransferase family 2 protein n=1 Tax=Methylocystis sp. TaxID=1911079 RepID=UPI003DA22DDF